MENIVCSMGHLVRRGECDRKLYIPPTRIFPIDATNTTRYT